MYALSNVMHEESKRATYVLNSTVSVPNRANPASWELQTISITALMQMQAIKQNVGKTTQCKFDMQMGRGDNGRKAK